MQIMQERSSVYSSESSNMCVCVCDIVTENSHVLPVRPQIRT
jgi:hypothetical protein